MVAPTDLSLVVQIESLDKIMRDSPLDNASILRTMSLFIDGKMRKHNLKQQIMTMVEEFNYSPDILSDVKAIVYTLERSFSARQLSFYQDEYLKKELSLRKDSMFVYKDAQVIDRDTLLLTITAIT